MKQLECIIRELGPPMEPIPTGMEPELTQFDGVKAVVFDVYGTLFISGSGDVGTAAATDTAKALEQALAAAGFEGDLELAGKTGKEMLAEEIRAEHNAAHDNGIEYPEVEITEIWARIIPRLFDVPADAEQIRRLALEYECRVNPVFPMPGSVETIKDLKNRGLVLGIVSNAQFYTPLLFPAFINQSVEETGFDPDCCIWSYLERKAKPSPDLFPALGQCLMDRHGIGLHECVYVGNDMLNDVYCAKAADCRAVLFAGDKRSLRLRENNEHCLAIRPDAVITSLTQLPGMILNTPERDSSHG